MENTQQILARINSMPVPRRLKPRWKVMAGPGILFLVPVILILVMHGSIISSLATYFGKAVQAEIEEPETWITHGKHSTTTHYGAYVRYPYPEKTMRARIETGESVYNRLSRNDRLEIRYFEWAPKYPSAGYGGAVAIIIPALMLIIFGTIGAWLIRSHYVLLSSGTAAAGKVIEVIKGNKNTYTWKVSYVYNGQTIVKNMTGSADAPDETAVVLNPAKPDRADVYENLCWKLDENVLN